MAMAKGRKRTQGAYLRHQRAQARQAREQITPPPEYVDQDPDPRDLADVLAAARDLDEMTEAEGWHMAIQKLAPVDFRAIAPVAKERVDMILKILDKEDDGTPVPERDRLVINWMDAFTIGYFMSLRRAAEVRQIVDESISRDGNTRRPLEQE